MKTIETVVLYKKTRNNIYVFKVYREYIGDLYLLQGIVDENRPIFPRKINNKYNEYQLIYKAVKIGYKSNLEIFPYQVVYEEEKICIIPKNRYSAYEYNKLDIDIFNKCKKYTLTYGYQNIIGVDCICSYHNKVIIQVGDNNRILKNCMNKIKKSLSMCYKRTDRNIVYIGVIYSDNINNNYNVIIQKIYNDEVIPREIEDEFRLMILDYTQYIHTNILYPFERHEYMMHTFYETRKVQKFIKYDTYKYIFYTWFVLLIDKATVYEYYKNAFDNDRIGITILSSDSTYINGEYTKLMKNMYNEYTEEVKILKVLNYRTFICEYNVPDNSPNKGMGYDNNEDRFKNFKFIPEKNIYELEIELQQNMYECDISLLDKNVNIKYNSFTYEGIPRFPVIINYLYDRSSM